MYSFLRSVITTSRTGYVRVFSRGYQTRHDFIRDRLAMEMNGVTEYPIKGVGVCDVMTDTYTIEVKPGRYWKQGLGQAMAYGKGTGKIPALHLYDIGKRDVETMYYICDLCGVMLTLEEEEEM